MHSPRADYLVVGAGIVGAACARELARAGATVDLLEQRCVGAGATAAGMGHLVTMRGVPGELEFTSAGVDMWRRAPAELLRCAEYDRAGTLWIATSSAEVEQLQQQAQAFGALGIEASLLDARALALVEPALSGAALAGMRVPGDAIIYPPKAAQWLAGDCGRGRIRLHQGVRAQALGADWVLAADGRRFEAAAVVVAAGLAARSLLPGLPLLAKRGHLLISERGGPRISHQILELGYAASTHAQDAVSIAFNVQPRPSGQLLIGASREIGVEDRAESLEVLARIAHRAVHFLPGLATHKVIRTWTGLRPATPQGMPMLGAVSLPAAAGSVWVAVGHEGLGATTALVSARILAAKMLGQPLPAGLAGGFDA